MVFQSQSLGNIQSKFLQEMGYMGGRENCGMWLTCKGSFLLLLSFRENWTARNLKVQEKKAHVSAAIEQYPIWKNSWLAWWWSSWNVGSFFPNCLYHRAFVNHGFSTTSKAWIWLARGISSKWNFVIWFLILIFSKALYKWYKWIFPLNVSQQAGLKLDLLWAYKNVQYQCPTANPNWKSYKLLAWTWC